MDRKDNRLHDILCFVLKVQADGKTKYDWNYDDLMPSIKDSTRWLIIDYCDKLEKAGLVDHHKEGEYISLKHVECLKARDSERFKEIEIIEKVNPLDKTVKIVAIGEGIFVIASVIIGWILLSNSNKLEQENKQLLDSLQVKNRTLDSLEHVLTTKDQEILKLQQADSLQAD